MVVVVVAIVATITLLYRRSKSDRIDEIAMQSDGMQSDEMQARSPIHETASKDVTRDELTEQFMEMYESGRLTEAERVLRRILLDQPDDGEAIFYLAKLSADQNNPTQAIELLQSIPPRYSHLRLPTLGMTADLQLATDEFDSALATYSEIAEQFPEARMASRQMAYLYNRMGRRHEANRVLKRLALEGDVLQEELVALLIESDAMSLDSDQASPIGSRVYLPIGAAAKARALWTQSQYKDAVALLEPLISEGRACASDRALYGVCLSEAQLDEKARAWLARAGDDLQMYPEYWAAVGNLCFGSRDWKAATGAYREAVARDPSDIRTVRRLRQCLSELGDEQAAKKWSQRFDDLIAVVELRTQMASRDTPDPQIYEAMAKALSKLERNIEAISWSWLAMMQRQPSVQRQQELTLRRQQLLAAKRGFPSVEHATCHLTADRFPRPEISRILANLRAHEFPDAPPSVEPSSVAAPTEQFGAARGNASGDIRFSEAAGNGKVDFRYRLETADRRRNFTIYQTLGGGVAIVDYDLDGMADLYFPQADADGPAFLAVSSDRLYRNSPSAAQRLTFVDVSRDALAADHDYSIGITAGDWNQDGFPDLLVSNIGPERLLTNQGDGTFVTTLLDFNDSTTCVSASVAIADLNADQIPDLYVQNYINDPSMMRRPPQDANGFAKDPVNPYSYTPASDLVWIGSETGRFRPMVLGDKKDASTGLGVVITELGPSPGLELYVANDERPNQLWHHDPLQNEFVDTALLRGSAHGHSGNAQGSMGIACGDLDASGTPDLFVTNFYNESNNVFMNTGGYFRDLNVRCEVDRVSTFVVGFGCQAVDLDHNGQLELIVVNGHVEDLSPSRVAFQQRPQLLAREDEAYRQIEGAKVGEYFAKPSLGRALARGDFDGDGRIDLVVTDLLAPSTVLLNETETSGNWIGLKLIGTTCERDAIGTKVEVTCANQTRYAWVTTGDGYLCKNDSRLIVGIGDHEQVDRIEITWPDETRSTFTDLTAGVEHCLVQGDDVPFDISGYQP